jgi:DNA-directed RNA polymerase subunit RPC12/RpoP
MTTQRICTECGTVVKIRNITMVDDETSVKHCPECGKKTLVIDK